MIGKKLRSMGACLMAALMIGTVIAIAACDSGNDSSSGDDTLYTLVYESSSVAGGTVSGTPVSGEKVAAGTNVSLSATANAEYTFKGWYEGGSLVNADAAYSFTMPERDCTLSAVFEAEVASYTFTFDTSDDLMGTVTSEARSGAKQKTGDSITVTATPNDGYDFVGWYDEDNESVSTSATYTFTMPAHNYALTAKFAPTPIPTHAVSYASDDTTKGRVAGYANDEIFRNGDALEEGTRIRLEASPVDGMAFAGWFDKDTDELVYARSPYEFTLGEEDVDLIGKFIEDTCSLTVTLDNEAAGSFTIEVDGKAIENGEYVSPDSAVTLTATPAPLEKDYMVNRNEQDGYLFAGWYDDENKLKSLEPEYTFRMPGQSYTLEARFVKAYTYTAQKPSDAWAYVTLGSYPQTVKASEVTIASATPDALGYYTGSDGAKYIKISATPYAGGAFGSNAEVVEAGREYYFKVEPIRWRVLEEADGKMHLMSDIAVDNRAYQSHVNVQPEDSYVNYYGAPDRTYYANDYQFSEVRYWLNHDFYLNAFASLPRGVLTRFGVDNSGSWVFMVDGASYSSNNTKDYVALLSYDEVSNEDYGFNDAYEYLLPDLNRRVSASDYSIARGVFYFDDYKYYGGYWLRTAGATDSYSEGYVESEQVITVNSLGATGLNTGVLDTHRGVQKSGIVPSIWMETVALNDGLTLYNPNDLDFPENDPAADFTESATTALKAELGAALPADNKD